MKMMKSILSLFFILILAQAIYIRKQTIKHDDVLGEIILIEEIKDSNNAENLTEMLENNASLLEQDLDFASELANLLLNTIQGELVEDKLLSSEDQTYNAFEGMKDFVNTIQQVEHEYFEDLKNQKEDKDKRVVIQTKTKDSTKNFDHISQEHDTNKESVINDKVNSEKDSENNNQTQQNKLKNFTQSKQQENKVQDNSDVSVSKEESSNSKNTEDTQNSQQTKNFSVNSKAEPTKISMKIPTINMGVGPQISMKTVSSPEPLYKDPSVIVGIISLFILIGAVCYYFIKSSKNLRKSSSSILESSEIFLPKSSKGGQITYSEKIKII